MLALRLPDDIEKRLDNLAKRTGRSKSYYAREAIIEHLEDLEDIYRAESANSSPGISEATHSFWQRAVNVKPHEGGPG